MTTAKAWASRNRIVVCGQSQNLTPLGAGLGVVLATKLGGIPVSVTAISGVGWQTWAGTDWRHGLDIYAPVAERVVFAMCGGTADYESGRTGAQCYADQVGISVELKALGSAGQVKVIGSTTHPAFTFGARTTIAAGSDGVNISTLDGGTLNVESTAHAYSVSSKALYVTGDGGSALVSYSGLTGTSFTGCTSDGTGGIGHTGGLVLQRNYKNMYDGNALVLADASSAFDAIVDYAGDSRLADPSNTTYYGAGIVPHVNAAGRDVMLELLLVQLLPMLLSP